MGSATVRLQEDAKSIKETLTAVHSQQKSTQTSKILVDFEVRRPGRSAAVATCTCMCLLARDAGCSSSAGSAALGAVLKHGQC